MKVVITGGGGFLGSQLCHKLLERGELTGPSGAAVPIGQIVLLARSHRGADWQFMSIPPGGSAEYNRHPDLEKSPRQIKERP